VNIYKNTIEVARNSFNDEGEGIVSFPNGLVISDSEVQRNGTRYDIDSLDISKYAGQLTADHEDKLQNIIGRVEGVKKNNGRVTVDRIVYAVKQNPLARLAYDLLVGGFSKAFSTETMGISNTADGTLANHELVGLSQVVVPNNYSACINSLKKSLNQAKADGLDVSGIETILNGENQMDEEVKTPSEEVKEVEAPATEEVKEAEPVEEATKPVEEVENASEEKTENSAEEEAPAESEEPETKEADKPADEVEEVEKELEADNSAEEIEENEVETTDNEISNEEVKELFDKIDNLTKLVEERTGFDEPDGEIKVEKIVEEDLRNSADETEENLTKEENSMTKDEFANAFAEAMKNYFGDAKAPEFKKEENSADYSKLDSKEIFGKQVNAAWDAFRGGNIEARKTLNELNKVNYNALKEAGIVKNAMTIESMGNFVLPPEMYREIIGHRNDYSAILDATDWQDTDRLEFAFLRRNGDISMKNVALCDDGENGNLKPISEYSAEPVTEKLEELAAVTVVCTAATRFFAADLLGDVAAGYRNDYDRKRAQLVIAKLEQAVIETGNEVSYDATSDTGAMVAWLDAMSKISDTTTEGTLVFNSKTFAKLKAHALEAGVNGPLSEIFTTGDIPRIFGMRYIVVPNDLMPTIESDDSVAFEVQGVNVPITHAVFYGDLREFTGRTSGGLQYDLSTDASYEVDGIVKSAYQRNELVLRGSFFRGGAIKDNSRIAGILQTPAES